MVGIFAIYAYPTLFFVVTSPYFFHCAIPRSWRNIFNHIFRSSDHFCRFHHIPLIINRHSAFICTLLLKELLRESRWESFYVNGKYSFQLPTIFMQLSPGPWKCWNTRKLLKLWKQVEGLRIFFCHHRSVQQIQQLGAHRLGLQYERGQGQVIQTDRIVPSGERHLLTDLGICDIVNFSIGVEAGWIRSG